MGLSLDLVRLVGSMGWRKTIVWAQPPSSAPASAAAVRISWPISNQSKTGLAGSHAPVGVGGAEGQKVGTYGVKVIRTATAGTSKAEIGIRAPRARSPATTAPPASSR